MSRPGFPTGAGLGDGDEVSAFLPGLRVDGQAVDAAALGPSFADAATSDSATGLDRRDEVGAALLDHALRAAFDTDEVGEIEPIGWASDQGNRLLQNLAARVMMRPQGRRRPVRRNSPMTHARSPNTLQIGR